jgi:hypothetical protein
MQISGHLSLHEIIDINDLKSRGRGQRRLRSVLENRYRSGQSIGSLCIEGTE